MVKVDQGIASVLTWVEITWLVIKSPYSLLTSVVVQKQKTGAKGNKGKPFYLRESEQSHLSIYEKAS